MLNSRALNLLWNAREVIAEAKHWTQGTRARDSQFQAVDPRSLQAVQWDILGALDSITALKEVQARARSFLAEEAWARGARSFVELNDTRPHLEVMSLMDAAIKRAKYAEGSA